MRFETRTSSIKNTKPAFGPLLLIEFVLLLGPTVSFTRNLMLHDQQRMEQIVLLCLLAVGGILVWRAELAGITSRIPRWNKLFWILGFGLGLISAVLAQFPRYAILEWSTFFLLAWCALLVGGQSQKEGMLFDRWATRIVVLVVIFISMKVAIYYWLALSADALDTRKLFSQSFSNPRFFGQAASMLLPVLAVPLLRDRNSRIKTGAIFSLLAMLWMWVIASGTRGTWLAILVAVVILALVSWRASLPWIKLQLASCLAGVGLFVIFFIWLPQGGYVESRLDDMATLSNRELIWGIAWQQIQQHPWFGIGPMHLAAINNPVASHPHNALLQLGAEWGLPATCALLSPLIFAMAAFLSRIRKQNGGGNTPLLVCLSASLLAATVHSLVDGVIVMPYSQTLLVFICGWALGLYLRPEGEEAKPSSQKSILQINVLLPTLALGLMLFGLYPELFNRVEVTRQLISEGVTWLHPRYWAHGWIPQ